ncbi:CD99 antigen-like protein 2 [Echeneis naucrates]|uniref:CD99 antigen-like protein 2 n=1 Tax=Echeneis naucrates TaxID=173247 RepID=A0A665V332_ECHNA|nr:CD99 antigen-like protein 2 [Echeneis naucrates]
MASRPLWTLSLLPALLVLSQGLFNLADALDDSKSMLESHDSSKVSTTTTSAPPKVLKDTGDMVKNKSKPADDLAGFDLADALDPKNDIGDKEKNKGQGGGFSDSDLVDVSKDDTYKPDKGKGGARGRASDQINQYDDNTETTAEVGTIAGIASAVAMALVGAVTSYISYQKKKLCFSLQQSLNTDMVKAENPEAMVATEPQVQKTLLEPPNAEPPTVENAV